MITAARYKKGYERLEPDVAKVASPVLRRGRASNRSFLFSKLSRTVLRRGRASNRSFLFGTANETHFMLPKALKNPELILKN